MSRKETYRLQNEAFLEELAGHDDVHTLDGGVLYRVISDGSGMVVPGPRSIVTVHYTGTLVSGKVFDDTRRRQCPKAFRVNELIEGFQTALCKMHAGDRWQVFIPCQKGYGRKAMGDIPGCSTLVFDVELISVA